MNVSSRLDILMFHRVLEKGFPYFIPPMSVSQETFTGLLQWIARFREIVPLDQAVERLRNGTLSRRTVALTFDDGYRDNFDAARPVLNRLGMPATFFVPVHQIDKQEVYWWDYLYLKAKNYFSPFKKWVERYSTERLASSPSQHDFLLDGVTPETFARGVVRQLNAQTPSVRKNFMHAFFSEFGAYDGVRQLMTWHELAVLTKEGFSIGSHGLSHVPLTDLTHVEATRELKASRQILSERLGTVIFGFSYPRGNFDKEIVQAVPNAGYSYAAGTKFGSNSESSNLYTLARRNISNFSGVRSYAPILMHLIELSGLLDPILTSRRTYQR